MNPFYRAYLFIKSWLLSRIDSGENTYSERMRERENMLYYVNVSGYIYGFDGKEKMRFDDPELQDSHDKGWIMGVQDVANGRARRNTEIPKTLKNLVHFSK